MSLNLLEADRLGELRRYYVKAVEWGETRYALVYHGPDWSFYVFDSYPQVDAIFGSSLMTDKYWSRLSTTEKGAWEHLPDDLKALRAKM